MFILFCFYRMTWLPAVFCLLTRHIDHSENYDKGRRKNDTNQSQSQTVNRLKKIYTIVYIYIKRYITKYLTSFEIGPTYLAILKYMLVQVNIFT